MDLRLQGFRLAESVVLMRSRTLSSSCAVRLPVTSPGRTCESMAALYQLCREAP